MSDEATSTAPQTGELQAPKVDVGFNTRVLPLLYTCRWVSGLPHKGQKQQSMIRGQYEILTPDKVPDYTAVDENTPKDEAGNYIVPVYQVAGRKGDAYFCVDPTDERGYTQTFQAMQKLGLLTARGTLAPAKIMEVFNSGRWYFQATLDSELQFKRYAPRKVQDVNGNWFMQKFGDPIKGPDGQPISDGWRLKLLNAGDILGRCPAPTGFPEFAGQPF